MSKAVARFTVEIERDESLSHVDADWERHAQRFTNPNAKIRVHRVGGKHG